MAAVDAAERTLVEPPGNEPEHRKREDRPGELTSVARVALRAFVDKTPDHWPGNLSNILADFSQLSPVEVLQKHWKDWPALAVARQAAALRDG